jgi:signal transduction histidine kinase
MLPKTIHKSWRSPLATVITPRTMGATKIAITRTQVGIVGVPRPDHSLRVRNTQKSSNALTYLKGNTPTENSIPTCIVNDTDRASDIVDRIGSLIKKAPPRKEVVDPNAAILEVTALTYSEAVKTGVTVGTQLAGELPRIQGDRVELQQVMLNLIVNAIQSMSGVEDGNRELHISTVSIETEGVCVAVRDTGQWPVPLAAPLTSSMTASSSSRWNGAFKIGCHMTTAITLAGPAGALI